MCKRAGGGGGGEGGLAGGGGGEQRILYTWLFYYEFLKSFVTFISLEILITMIYFLYVIIIGENFAEH